MKIWIVLFSFWMPFQVTAQALTGKEYEDSVIYKIENRKEFTALNWIIDIDQLMAFQLL